MTESEQERDGQADDKEHRQPERNREETRDYAHEDQAMPGDSEGRLGELDEALDTQEYPATTNELIEAYGDYEIETQNGVKPLEEVLDSTDDQTFGSADDVRSRVLGLVHR